MSASTKNLLAFLFGLGSVTQIRMIGAMGISEAITVFLAPFVLINTWQKLKEAKGQTILFLLLLWMLSAGFTDLYRETETKDAIKGVVAIPFLAAMFIISFALLWDDIKRVRWIALGMALSAIISIYAFRTQALLGRAESVGEAVEGLVTFKTVYAGVLLLVIGALTALLFRNWPLITVWILLISSAIFLYGGSRNGFLVLLLSAGGAWLAQGRFLSLRAIQRRTAILAIFVAIGGLIAVETYVYAVESGWLGEEALTKYEDQSESDIGLLSGRAEFVAAILAIKDSPIIGHGSWAIDKENYGSQMLEYIGEYEAANFRDQRMREQDFLLPTHSHLWQSWVWHGLFGGLFWMFVLVLMIRFFKHALHLCRPLIAYFILLLITAGWDLLFSPFSQRPRWGILFAVIVLSLAEVDRRRKKAALAGTEPDMESEWDGKWSG